MKHDIFLSYRRPDRELAVQLARELDKRGLSVWYDANISGGDGLRDEIVAALDASAMLVILFSESCNEHRELQKEIALADSVEKPVVPILIENCRPKGGHIYELADRNWIEAWPEPHSRIPELVELLTALAGKSPESVTHVGDNSKGPERELAGKIDAMPSMASAYIGRKDKRLARAARRSDILPFLWLDLAALVPALGVLAFLVLGGPALAEHSAIARLGLAALICVAGVGVYGAIAFPARYYLRGRPVKSAIQSYAVSSTILLAVAVALLAIVKLQGGASTELAPTAILLGFVWGALAIISFTIYGVLAGQRALARFNANLRQI
jgi:hypothetical protein